MNLFFGGKKYMVAIQKIYIATAHPLVQVLEGPTHKVVLQMGLIPSLNAWFKSTLLQCDHIKNLLKILTPSLSNMNTIS